MKVGFILISFIYVLILSVINACTAPVLYLLNDVNSWAPVAFFGGLFSLLMIIWFCFLWNEVVPNISLARKLGWKELCGVVTLIMFIKNLIP